MPDSLTQTSGKADAAPVRARGALGRFARRAAVTVAASNERCDLCSESIPSPHRHLLESATRHIVCVCQACAILFSQRAASVGKYRLVPDRRLRLEGFDIGDTEWLALRVPVGLCFLVVRDGSLAAFYPSQTGATEALIDEDVLDRYGVRSWLEPEVEALLVNRARGARDYFIVPIDTCFSLVGLIRLRWRGLSGGTEVWTEIGRFFESLRAGSRAIDLEVVQGNECQSAST
jgi:hypothetical protein